MDYDIIVIGSGPGGYVAAIRAAQLKMKVAVIERAEIGGICLNWGCIPTKALLKSAQVYEYVTHAAEYGINLGGEAKPDLAAMVARSRGVAEGMSKGVMFLFKKNNVELIKGTAKLAGGNNVEVVEPGGQTRVLSASNIILATGARPRDLPGLPINHRNVISYREAMTLESLPGSMVVVGSGAIGSEFASLYRSLGTEVTLVEYLPRLVPNEDEEISKQLERNFRKMKMKIMTGSSVESVEEASGRSIVKIKTSKGEETVETDLVLSAAGVTPNIENLGLETTGVKVEKGKVAVDDYYRTSVEGIFAIGDIVHGPALAHVASAEGIICVEKIAGLNTLPLDYKNIPACTYTNPEIASCGLTEAAAREAGYTLKVGKFPFTASGKANAAGTRDGFVKLIFDAAYGELLGAHMIGANVTEMIGEIVLARKLETTAHEIIKAVHPHPTMSEAIMEAAAAAYDEVIHI